MYNINMTYGIPVDGLRPVLCLGRSWGGQLQVQIVTPRYGRMQLSMQVDAYMVELRVTVPLCALWRT